MTAPLSTPPPDDAPLAGAKTAWVVSDGTKGMEVQSMGRAARMGLKTKLIRVSASRLESKLPRLAPLPLLPLAAPLAEAAGGGWPDVVVTTGRRMAGFSIMVRRRSRGATRSVHVQDPRLPPGLFDWMVVPSHDHLRGGNVLVTTGSLNALTPDKIKREGNKLKSKYPPSSRPVIAFMIGGSNRRYSVHDRDYFALGEFAANTASSTGSILFFVPSRRSMKNAGDAIRAAMEAARKRPDFFIWDGKDPNPYPGVLGLADAVIVTSDSVNMASEACLSGKPVYRYDFREETGRIGLFHRILEEGRHTRPAKFITPFKFPGTPGPVLDETGRVAALLTGG